MTEQSENNYVTLSKKVDDQARFTRAVMVICTLAVLGVNFYSLTSLVSTLPDLTLAHAMGNLEQVVKEWKLIENADNLRAKESEEAKANK